MTYIVAEVGSNFRNRDECTYSIGQAKALGADAVKFQMFSERELYGYGSTVPMGIDPAWLSALKAKANVCGIDLMCTAFSPEGVVVVDPYVKTHKVASAEAMHVGILQAVAKTGKPVFVSTGGHDWFGIKRAIECLEDQGASAITVLYCVAEYPTRRVHPRALFEHLGLDGLKANWGFSDHTLDVLGMPVVAACLGASVIEKHVNFVGAEGTPDAPHSLSSAEFGELVHAIRTVKQKGEWRLEPLPCEKDMVMRHNRRLIVTHDIAEGAPFVFGENFGIYRSREDDLSGLAPDMWPRVTGRIARRAHKPGEALGPMSYELV